MLYLTGVFYLTFLDRTGYREVKLWSREKHRIRDTTVFAPVNRSPSRKTRMEDKNKGKRRIPRLHSDVLRVHVSLWRGMWGCS